MSSGVITRIAATTAGAVALYGVVVPNLISAASDVALYSGLGVAAGGTALIGTQIRKLWLQYRTSREIARYEGK